MRPVRATLDAMNRTTILGKALALLIVGTSVVACVAEVRTEGTVECRNTLRRRGEVEVCRTRCNEEMCRTRCVEQERWSREHHCWVE
jgi:hypothetical protein